MSCKPQRSLTCLLVAGALGASSTAAAQTGAADEQVQELIVTAQKRGEAMNDVPMSIRAAEGEERARRQLTSPDDLARFSRDLKTQAQFGSFGRTFRGIGPANRYNLNVQQPVGTYMDELYQTFATTPGLQLFDLERVEIPKGPQGTLFGRNNF